MSRSQCTEEQIIGVRREHEAGMKVAEVCRKHGIPALPSPSVRAFIDHLSAELPKRSLTGVGREQPVSFQTHIPGKPTSSLGRSFECQTPRSFVLCVCFAGH
jgi:hypothetical protein